MSHRFSALELRGPECFILSSYGKGNSLEWVSPFHSGSPDQKQLYPLILSQYGQYEQMALKDVGKWDLSVSANFSHEPTQKLASHVENGTQQSCI